jgi:hypothetical protein
MPMQVEVWPERGGESKEIWHYCTQSIINKLKTRNNAHTFSIAMTNINNFLYMKQYLHIGRKE